MLILMAKRKIQDSDIFLTHVFLAFRLFVYLSVVVVIGNKLECWQLTCQFPNSWTPNLERFLLLGPKVNHVRKF